MASKALLQKFHEAKSAEKWEKEWEEITLKLKNSGCNLKIPFIAKGDAVKYEQRNFVIAEAMKNNKFHEKEDCVNWLDEWDSTRKELLSNEG